MQYVKFTDLRNQGTEVFNQVEKGEEFVVTRRGLPIAQIIPFVAPKSGPKSWQRPLAGAQVKGPSSSKLLIELRRGETR